MVIQNRWHERKSELETDTERKGDVNEFGSANTVEQSSESKTATTEVGNNGF